MCNGLFKGSRDSITTCNPNYGAYSLSYLLSPMISRGRPNVDFSLLGFGI